MSLEQCTSLQVTAAGYLPTSFSDTDQLSLLSGIPTLARYSEKEPQTDGFQACECGRETLGCSIHPNTPEAWTAFMRDSLAKTLASLESKQVYLREPDQVFTAKSCGSLAWYDQSNSTWKTYQQSLVTDWEPYSETWPRWGMTQGGSAYVHPMSERRITETDGFCLPTPRANSAMASTITPESAWKGNRFPNLETVIGRQIWPTPTLDSASSRTKKYAQGGMPLTLAVKMWPTPTPTAHNAKETNAPSESTRNTPTLAAQVGGQLNPDWVEWLMAFPVGFTVSKEWKKVK